MAASTKVRINFHGLFGVVLILVAVGTAMLKHWQIPWLYFLVAIVGYCLAVLILTFAVADLTKRRAEKFDLMRVMYGAHLSFMFLIVSLLLSFSGFWLGFGIFVASVAAGMVIPFLLVHRT